MTFAVTKLPGLDSARLLALIEPVLSTHGVEGVELIWKGGERGGMVLLVTVEVPGTTVTGEGVTIDLLADISRDLSAVLDVEDLIRPRYALEVGSPGVERHLYRRSDYERFVGQPAKIKLKEPLPLDGPEAGQKVIVARIAGLGEEGFIRVETGAGELLIPETNIAAARLVLDWKRGEKGQRGPAKKKEPGSNGPKSREKERSK